jgi:hypothetical protein
VNNLGGKIKNKISKSKSEKENELTSEEVQGRIDTMNNFRNSEPQPEEDEVLTGSTMKVESGSENSMSSSTEEERNPQEYVPEDSDDLIAEGYSLYVLAEDEYTTNVLRYLSTGFRRFRTMPSKSQVKNKIGIKLRKLSGSITSNSSALKTSTDDEQEKVPKMNTTIKQRLQKMVSRISFGLPQKMLNLKLRDLSLIAWLISSIYESKAVYKAIKSVGNGVKRVHNIVIESQKF